MDPERIDANHWHFPLTIRAMCVIAFCTIVCIGGLAVLFAMRSRSSEVQQRPQLAGSDLDLFYLDRVDWDSVSSPEDLVHKMREGWVPLNERLSLPESGEDYDFRTLEGLPQLAGIAIDSRFLTA